MKKVLKCLSFISFPLYMYITCIADMKKHWFLTAHNFLDRLAKVLKIRIENLKCITIISN